MKHNPVFGYIITSIGFSGIMMTCVITSSWQLFGVVASLYLIAICLMSATELLREVRGSLESFKVLEGRHEANRDEIAAKEFNKAVTTAVIEEL
jgi:hypothetical protein